MGGRAGEKAGFDEAPHRAVMAGAAVARAVRTALPRPTVSPLGLKMNPALDENHWDIIRRGCLLEGCG